MEGLTGDIETQALKTQREIYRQLGRLKQLRVLWLGHETRDFGNLDSHRVTLDERRLELGLPKKDPKRVFEVNEEEEEQEKDVALSEEENVGANEGLDLMSELKKLVELNVGQMAYQISVEEVQWMMAHWPKQYYRVGCQG
ncbi:hypothetical protein BGZ97_008288 [Linnemannia gamsii]|uniref:Uncharacterized protein n=1 Tax=Linnemannia gamsii TaxID=64522 RepID=A0A9P6UPP5_9FUNG|nr:hypothetical protein BGZ97_008288 [Linnemannia gamsii]